MAKNNASEGCNNCRSFGAGGRIGPGSENHWSDWIPRSGEAQLIRDYFLMSSSVFDQRYGDPDSQYRADVAGQIGITFTPQYEDKINNPGVLLSDGSAIAIGTGFITSELVGYNIAQNRGSWLEDNWNHPVTRAITGDAFSISIDIDAVTIGGFDIEPIGLIIPLRGENAFEPISYSTISGGIGADASVSIKVGKMYYLGNAQTFTHNSFNGPSVGLNAAITAGVDFGAGAAYAPDLSGRSLGILSTYSSVGYRHKSLLLFRIIYNRRYKSS